MRFERGVMSTLLTALLLGCQSDSEEIAGEDPGALSIPSESVRIVGTSESLAIVLDLEVLPDGTVWALNSLAPFFVAFDSTGAVIEAHGTEGGGPEQFQLPSAFVTGGAHATVGTVGTSETSPPGEVWVLDIRRHSLVRVSSPDEGWAEVPLPRDAIPPGTVRGGIDLTSPVVRTARLGEEVILPQSMVGLEAGVNSMVAGMLQADLLAFDPESGVVEPMLSLGSVLGDPFEGFIATEEGFPFWRRLWAVCGENELRVFDRVRHQLRGFDRSGAELPTIDLPPETRITQVGPRQFAQVVFPLRQAEMTGGGSHLSEADSARLLNEMVGGLQGTPTELAAYLPMFSDFRCSPQGTMWLRPFDADEGGLSGGRGWLEISPNGAVREIEFPQGFDPFRFADGRVWGVQRDQFDVASIAWAPLPFD